MPRAGFASELFVALTLAGMRNSTVSGKSFLQRYLGAPRQILGLVVEVRVRSSTFSSEVRVRNSRPGLHRTIGQDQTAIRSYRKEQAAREDDCFARNNIAGTMLPDSPAGAGGRGRII